MTKKEMFNKLSQIGINPVIAKDGVPEIFVRNLDEFDLIYEKFMRIAISDEDFHIFKNGISKRKGAVICRIMECIG